MIGSPGVTYTATLLMLAKNILSTENRNIMFLLVFAKFLFSRLKQFCLVMLLSKIGKMSVVGCCCWLVKVDLLSGVFS